MATININISGIASENGKFNTIDQAAPLLYTNHFDDGTYNKAENGVTCIDLRYGVVDTDFSVSSAYSVGLNWEGNSEQFSEFRYDLGGQKREVIVEFQLYTPANMTMVELVGVVVNQKFARFWTGPATGGDPAEWYNTLTGIEKSGLDWWADNAGIDADLSMSVSGLWAGDAAPMNPAGYWC